MELAEGDEMVYRAASGMAARLLGLRLKRASSLSGLCVETNEALRCDDSETDPRVDREACRKVGLRSMVVAPLVHDGTAVGVLKIVSPTKGFFTDQHLCILRIMCRLIAASMFHAARHETEVLYHSATHDTLTGLANRALFHDRLRQGMDAARRKGSLAGVLNLDMDGLKSINDRFGHRAGDAAIRELAERLGRVVRESDTVARLGGDEFGIILPGIRDRSVAESAVARIRSEFPAPLTFEGASLAIEASIGLAVFPEDAGDLDELLETADKLMYRDKQARKQAPSRRNEAPETR